MTSVRTQTHENSTDVSSARFMAVLGVTAVLFFLCLLPFELIPEIPVDIDSKPFFVPLALCALLPARRAGLAIGLGVALGEGLRDLMEGYELDDPIGFFGYIFGFWAASWVIAIAPRSRLVLVLASLICAFVQAAIEASSFLLFGSEGFIITVESTIGNTITHGFIWGAVPLVFIVPALRGKFESYLGFEIRGAKLPPPMSTEASPDDLPPMAAAYLGDVSFRYPGTETHAVSRAFLEIRRGEVLGLAGAQGSGKSTLALLLSGLAPGATGGSFVGAQKAPESAMIVNARPGDYLTEARAIHQVAAAGLAEGGDSDTALAGSAEILRLVGLPDEKHQAYVWTLNTFEQGLVLVAATVARQPELIIIDEAASLFAEEYDRLLDILFETRADLSSVLFIESTAEQLLRRCERFATIVGGKVSTLTSTESTELHAILETALHAPAVESGDQLHLWSDTAKPTNIPTLQRRQNGWWHARDPRIKWAMFISVILMIYIAPSWQWMAALVGLGVIAALTARPSPTWMAFALLVQIPNILGLILLPLLGGEASTLEELEFGLRLGLGWLAAILFGISLLSTMDIPEMVAGLRGLGLPRRFAFVIGFSFVLIYLSMADFARHVSVIKLDGRALLRRPVSLLKTAAGLFVPIVSTVARRGGAMAIALETMNRGRGVSPFRPRWGLLTDTFLAIITTAILVTSILARWYG